MTGKRMERTMRADRLAFPGGAAKPHPARGGRAWRRGGTQNLKGEARDGRDDAGVVGTQDKTC